MCPAPSRSYHSYHPLAIRRGACFTTVSPDFGLVRLFRQAVANLEQVMRDMACTTDEKLAGLRRKNGKLASALKAANGIVSAWA